MITRDYSVAAQMIQRGGGAEAKLRAVMMTVECDALINAKAGKGTRITFAGDLIYTEAIPGPPHIEYEFEDEDETED